MPLHLLAFENKKKKTKQKDEILKGQVRCGGSSSTFVHGLTHRFSLFLRPFGHQNLVVWIYAWRGGRSTGYLLRRGDWYGMHRYRGTVRNTVQQVCEPTTSGLQD